MFLGFCISIPFFPYLLKISSIETPDIVFISTNLRSVVEGGKFQLRCDIINVAPAQSLAVHWYQGNDTSKQLIKGGVPFL